MISVFVINKILQQSDYSNVYKNVNFLNAKRKFS